MSDEHIDAINQVFALFRVNYHNQYYSAFQDVELLNHAKRLWLETLQRFSSNDILRGAKKAIEQSEYLPTLHKMIQFCQGDLGAHGLPDAHSAYIEACHAPSPKTSHHWSHAAVYHAGKQSDWFFITSSPENVAFPIFKQHYLTLCQQVISGITLPEPQPLALPEETRTPLSKKENAKRLDKLRKELDL